MRWKLLLLASLVAALCGACGTYLLLDVVEHFKLIGFSAPYFRLIFIELLPLILSLGSGIFVYRHTARRRKLQAILTISLSLLLPNLFIFLAVPLFIHFLPAYGVGG